MTVQAHTASIAAENTAACPFCGAPTVSGRPFCAACGQPGAPLLTGAKLHNAYVIAELLSASATGAVYRAKDTRRKREVAIKELLAPVGSTETERAALQSAFVREARRLSALRHPCLPQVHDSFSENGRHYLVMALMPGQNLSGVLDARRMGFPEAQVRAWAQHLFSLLDYLQAQQTPFVHGEIMPAHMMARPDGTPVLINFGLSWRLGLRPRILLPGAAAPEPGQAPGATRRLHLGRKQATDLVIDQPTPRDDLYGVSATVHAMLTGRDAFDGVSELGLAFPLVRDLAPRVSVGTAEAVNRALSPDHEVRFTSVGAFRAALGMGAPGAVRGYVPAYRPAAPAGRAAAFTIFVVTLALIAGLAVYAVQHAGSSLTVARGEINPDVAMPVAAQTLPLDDEFGQTGAAWYTDNQQALLRGNELWLANTAGTSPIKLTRSSYATGPGGFIARATVRLAQGPANATYGLVALDRVGTTWDNVALVVAADGRWALLRYHQHHAPALVAWHHSRYVRTGHNTPNELQLTFTPGRAGHPGAFAVTMNGHLVAKHVPAWAPAPVGRIGLLAGPGAEVAADSFIVGPVVPSKVTIEDHFLDNRLDWSLTNAPNAASPVQHGLLHVGPAIGVPWRAALPHHLVFPPMPSTVTDEATIAVRVPALQGQQAGGLIFARPLAGRRAPLLAVVIDPRNDVSVVELTARGAQPLAGPTQVSTLRMGSGLNTLRVRTTFFPQKKMSAQVQVNGRTLLQYKGANPGVEATAGVVTLGDATIDASALRLYGRGIHL